MRFYFASALILDFLNLFEILPSSSTHLVKTRGGFSNYLVDAWFKVYHCFLIVPSEALLYYVTFTTVTDYPSRTRGFLLVFW